MPFPVRCGGAQYRDPFLAAICDRHVRNGCTRRVKNNTLDSLGWLEFFNRDKFSNSLRRRDEEGAYHRDGCRTIHATIIGHPFRPGKEQIKRRDQRFALVPNWRAAHPCALCKGGTSDQRLCDWDFY